MGYCLPGCSILETFFYYIDVIFQRRISREGLLNEASDGGASAEINLDDSMHQLSRGGDGSTDPLLQIPTQLSAMLTLKRQNNGSKSKQTAVSSSTPAGSTADVRSAVGATTPLLMKRKRESIV